MISRAVEVAVETIMENHIYQFDENVYRQKDGGPIGLEITGVLARLVMLWWDREYITKLNNLGLGLELYKRYVDDSNMGSKPMKPGVRLVDGKLSILEEAIDEDKYLPADFRTAKLLRQIANTIIPMIKMKEDVPSNYQSGKLPILDLEVWVQGNRI